MTPRLSSLLLLSISSCASAPGPASTEPAVEPTPRRAAPSSSSGVDYRYVVRVDPDLRTLDVTVCSRQPLRRLVASGGSAPDHLIRAETRGEQGGVELAPEGRKVIVDDPVRCLGYVVDLRRAARSSRWGHLAEQGVVTLSSTEWLWRPAPRAASARGTVRFELPQGMAVAVPWAPAGEDTYRLDESAFRFLAHTAFGRLEPLALDVPGSEVRMVRLPGALAITDEELAQYVRSAIAAASSIYGRFPVDRVQVLIGPVGPGHDPVAFGHVGRGGGASVVLLVRRNAELDQLEKDWVAPHELAHLAMPYVQRSDAWLSEGIATYYQEVTRARAGAFDAARAWRGIDEGLERGRRNDTDRTLRRDSRDMSRTRAYHRVYWGGAAFALDLDVELRRRGLGSLDDLMESLHGCCQGWDGPWSAERLLSRWDGVIGEPLASRVAERHLEMRAVPEFEALYAYLGLDRDDRGRLVLDDSAPGAAIRRAITEAPTRGTVSR